MKETKIVFEETIPMKETPIALEDTVAEDKETIPWQQTLWKQVGAFGQSAKNAIPGVLKTIGGVGQQGYEDMLHEKDKEWTVDDAIDHWRSIFLDKIERKKNNQPQQDFKYYFSDEFKQQSKQSQPEYKKLLVSAKGAQKVVKAADEIIQTNAAKAKIDKSTEFTYGLGTGFFGNTLPGVAASVITRNPWVGSSLMGLSSSGQTYADARNQGASVEASQLAAIGAGTIDVLVEKYTVGQLLNPGKGFISTMIRNALSEVGEEGIAETLKMAIETQTITPDLTIKEAIARLKKAGVGALVLSPLMTVSTYPIVKVSEYRVNKAAEAAKTTMAIQGKEASQPLLEAPKPLSEGELENIVVNQRSSEEVLAEKMEINITPREEVVAPSLSDVFENQLKLWDEAESANSNIDTDEETSLAVSGETSSPAPPIDNSSVQEDANGETKISKTRTNTFENTTELSDRTKQELIPEAFRYEVSKAAETEQQARENLKEDPINVTKKLLDPSQPIDDTGVYEAAIIAKQMEGQINTPEGWSKYLNFMTTYAAKIRAAAKVLSAHNFAWDKIGAAVWNQTNDPSAYIRNVLDFIDQAKITFLSDKQDVSEDFAAAINGVTDEAQRAAIHKKFKVPFLSEEQARQIYDIWSAVANLPPTNLKRKKAAIQVKNILAKTIEPSLSWMHKASNKLREFSNGTLMWTLDSLLWVNNLSNLERFIEETYLPRILAKNVFGRGNAKVQKAMINQAKGQVEALRQMFLFNPVVGEVIDPVTNRVKRIKGQTMAETFDNIGELLGDTREGLRFLEDFFEATEYRTTNDKGTENKSDFYGRGRQLGSDPNDPATWLNTLYDLTVFLAARVPGHANRMVDNGYKQVYAYGKARQDVGLKADEAGGVGDQAIEYEAKLWEDVLAYFKGEPNAMTPEQQALVEEIFNGAVKGAEYQTGQQDLSRGLDAFNGFLNSVPFLREFIFRFLKTPVNWVKYHTWESMPQSQLLVAYKRDVLIGKRGTPYDQALARSTFAISMLKCTALLTLCAFAQVTGKHVSKEKKERFKAQIPEESIYNPITKAWINYGRYEIGRPLSALATIVDNLKHFPEKSEEALGAVLLTIMSTLDASVGSVTFQDIGNLYKAFAPDYYQEDAFTLENFYLKSQSKAYMPFSGLNKSVQRGSVGLGKDDHYREINTVLDQLVGVYVPEKLNPQLHNVTGEEVENTGTFAGMRKMKSPLEKHPGLLKIYQLGLAIGDAPEEIMGYKFNHQEYWEYRKLIDTKGQLAKKLDALVTSDGFDNNSRAVQERLIKNEIQNTRFLIGFDYLNSLNKLQEGLQNRVQTKVKDHMRSTGKPPDLTNPETSLDFLNFTEK